MTSSWVVSWQAPNVTETPTSAPSRSRGRYLSADNLLVVIFASRGARSIDDETEIALVACKRGDTAGNAVNPVDAGHQRRLGIGSRREPVIGTRQFLLGDRADDIGRHD